MLIADLCNYSDAYIVVKGKITVEENNVGKTKNKKLIFKSNAPFRSCISKNNNTFIVNAEDLDISMSMYNLLQIVAIILAYQEVCVIIIEMK